nr:MAG TPA: 3'-phosphoadenosine 5'-phosphosulfate sulfotransferase [Caudoviricetes sp.]
MNNILGRKQRIKNSEWLNAMENIESLVSKKDLESLVKKTVADIKRKTKGKKAAFAWSAGKDSLVLGQICHMAGINACVLVVCNLEYPAFLKWVEANKPPELEIINTGQDLRWLSNHPHMLFPQDSKTAAQWFHIVQHRGQARYYKDHELDVLLLGRRRADGNYVGKGENIYTNGQGVTRYSPLSEWSHEQVLAFIHYYNVALPPIYEWKNGYLCGTHPWAARQWTGSVENGWKEVYEIDRSVVKEAAEHIPSAKAFLESGVM